MKKPNNFGETFRSIRTSAGLSQADISSLMNHATPQMVSNIERGKCYFPRDILKKICRKYKFDYRELASLIVEEKSEKIKLEWLGNEI